MNAADTPSWAVAIINELTRDQQFETVALWENWENWGTGSSIDFVRAITHDGSLIYDIYSRTQPEVIGQLYTN